MHTDDNDDGGKLLTPQAQTQHKISQERKQLELEIRLVEALKSPAFNGGFDKLVSKVDMVVESQSTIANKVAEVYEAIYNPDVGLFARIKDVDVEREKDITELQHWRSSVNTDLLLDQEQDLKLAAKVEVHEKAIAELSQHRQRVVASLKWLLVALGGGGISLLFQWLSTFIG